MRVRLIPFIAAVAAAEVMLSESFVLVVVSGRVLCSEPFSDPAQGLRVDVSAAGTSRAICLPAAARTKARVGPSQRPSVSMAGNSSVRSAKTYRRRTGSFHSSHRASASTDSRAYLASETNDVRPPIGFLERHGLGQRAGFAVERFEHQVRHSGERLLQRVLQHGRHLRGVEVEQFCPPARLVPSQDREAV